MSLPTLNVLALRKLARRLSGVNAADYPDSDILLDFNDGYAELSVLLANLGEDYFEEQNTTFDLVANSSLYSQPQDCIAIKGVRLALSAVPTSASDYRVAVSNDSSNTHDISAQEESVPISNPIYDITGNYIRIKPTPKVNVAAGGKLDYIAMPSALVNTGDVPVFPIAYQKKLATFSAERMTFKFEKWQKNSRLKTDWGTTMAELQDRLADRDLDAPLRFKSPLEGGTSRVRELG